MDVSFVESQPYFCQNWLQGETEHNEAQFGETTIPLANTFSPIPAPVLDPSTSNSQEIGNHNNENKGNISLPLPNLDDS